jgi:hypothetical protein
VRIDHDGAGCALIRPHGPRPDRARPRGARRRAAGSSRPERKWFVAFRIGARRRRECDRPGECRIVGRAAGARSDYRAGRRRDRPWSARCPWNTGRSRCSGYPWRADGSTDRAGCDTGSNAAAWGADAPTDPRTDPAADAGTHCRTHPAAADPGTNRRTDSAATNAGSDCRTHPAAADACPHATAHATTDTTADP